MRTARSVLLLALALATVGCASATRTLGRTPQRVVVGPTDMGRTIRLEVGDRLVVDLGAPGGIVPVEWNLVLYPKEALRLTARDSDHQRFEFLAAASGTGQVVLAGRVGCDVPLAGSMSGPRCPLLGAGGSEGPGSSAAGPGIPVRRFAITVEVR